MATHSHRYAPGHALNREPMLYCDCGSQINARKLRSLGRSGLLFWNIALSELMAVQLRDGEEAILT